jgi:NADH-quinone oxidoreductase subunit L
MTRQVYLVFYGDERWRSPEVLAATASEPHQEADAAATGQAPVMHEEAPASSGAHDEGHGVEPHEAPPTMTFPLVVLAALSAIGGIINLPFVNQELDFLTRWLEPVFEVPEQTPSFSEGFLLSTVAVIIAVVGIVVAWSMYRSARDRKAADPTVERLGPFANVLANAYYLDASLARFVSGPVTAAADFLARVFDKGIIDGAVNGIATGTRELGGGLRRVQTGIVRNYALGIVLGAVLLMIWFATRVTL